MKKLSLLFSLALLMLFGFRAQSQTISISDGLTSDTICAGLSVTFTADTTGAGPYGYTWVLNGTNVGTSSPSFTATLLSGVNTIYCRLTNTAFTTYYASSDTLTITVDTLPVNQPITAATTPASVCIGDSITLADAATGGIWVSGNTTAATVDSFDGVVTGVSIPTGGGGGGFGGAPTVRVYYILTNNCGSDSSRIRVNIASPASPITLLSSTICMDSTVILTDSASGGTWTSIDSSVANFQTFGGFAPPVGILQGLSVGTTTIVYDVTNACGTYADTTTVTVINCGPTSVTNVATLANSCSIFPNPSTGTLNILANSDKYSKANCTIANMLGNKVQEFTINTNQESSVNLNIPSGVYFITVSVGDEKYSNKVVIME